MASTPQALRPRFHFAPARNWTNDPNGLIHHGGRWHLFFQYNPYGDEWGNMSWGHASSPDLVRWDEHPVAIPCTPEEQVWSGSVVADGDVLTAVYTAFAPDRRQAQALATSTDGGLYWQRWAANPVLDRGSTQFRDPKVFRHGDAWVMVAVEAEDHLLLLYRSTDLRAWELLAELPLDVGADVTAIECPDLFPLPYGDGERWVLLLSVLPDPDGGGSASRYCVGDFDGTTFTPQTPLRRMDHGPDFYAAATWTDAPDGRRVAVAWMSNWDYAAHVPTSPWRGSMTLPRELSLVDVDGVPTLAQAPVRELTEPPLVLAEDGELEFDGVRLVRTAGTLHVERGTFPLRREVALPPGPARVYTDHGSVELFSADGTVTVTALALG